MCCGGRSHGWGGRRSRGGDAEGLQLVARIATATPEDTSPRRTVIGAQLLHAWLQFLLDLEYACLHKLDS